MELGANPWDSLAKSGLLAMNEAKSLSESSGDSQAWLMRRLAKCKEDRYRRRNDVLSILLHPLIVLLFGGVVLWIAVAFFIVSVTLITVLA